MRAISISWAISQHAYLHKQVTHVTTWVLICLPYLMCVAWCFSKSLSNSKWWKVAVCKAELLWWLNRSKYRNRVRDDCLLDFNVADSTRRTLHAFDECSFKTVTRLMSWVLICLPYIAVGTGWQLELVDWCFFSFRSLVYFVEVMTLPFEILMIVCLFDFNVADSTRRTLHARCGLETVQSHQHDHKGGAAETEEEEGGERWRRRCKGSI